MATVAQTALDNALVLMDEVGSTEYNTKALAAINMLCGELLRYSDTYTVATAGKRPVLTPITTLSSVVGIDDYLAQSVLPYGLASQLLLGSDDTKANFLQQRYEELRNRAAFPTVSEDITNLYGTFGLYEE
jgi:hypothetical protein